MPGLGYSRKQDFVLARHTHFATAGHTDILAGRVVVVAGLQRYGGVKPGLGLGPVVAVELEVEGIAVELLAFEESVTWRPRVFEVLVRRGK